MTDAEFKQLLKNLRQPSKTSEGAETTITSSHNNDPPQSLLNKFMYANVPVPKINTSHKNQISLNHMFDGATGKKQTIDTLLKTNPSIWNTALSNELGRLAQGI